MQRIQILKLIKWSGRDWYSNKRRSYTIQWLRLHDMGFRLEVELERVEPEGEWEGNCNSSCTRKNIRQGSYTA